MTTNKEIRCVAMHIFQPDAAKLEAELKMFEEKEPQVKIRYNHNNNYDSTCMEIMLGMSVIGYVNDDDKRYVAPLLREQESCMADFLEVYREEGHTPIVRFLITVNLDDVEPLVPGELWEKWEYTYPTVPILDDLMTVTYAGDQLRDAIIKNTVDPFTTTDELLDAFVSASMFDMSVETSQRYDDLMFYLETSRRANRKYINKIQRGSTVRRTDRMRNRFLNEWWPAFLVGELSNRLSVRFAMEMGRKYGAMSEEIANIEYEALCKVLLELPYGLCDKIGDIKAMWATMYYTHIPRKKFIELLSAMVLYTKLTNTVKNKAPFIVEEKVVSINNNMYFNSEFKNYGTLTGNVNGTK